MPLSENEKRDITKYIEAGKPLPDELGGVIYKNGNELSGIVRPSVLQ
jgi:hypothetical protein